MGIYTRNGDLGFTTNLNGKKISKASYLIELQGGIDEINSKVGYLRSLLSKNINDILELQPLDHTLKDIQFLLFKMGTTITSEFTIPYVNETHVKALEDGIDQMTERTGALTKFLYLSGHETASYSHVLRSTIRRVERDFVRLITEMELTEVPSDYRFINRLADYFYQVARYLNVLYGMEEETMN